MGILVETSARHAHISEEHLEILFGKGHKLTWKKDLSQPGQYACEEKIEVIGPKSKLVMSILGPVRPNTQVEISLTDARTLGISAPIRESGDIKGSAGAILKGPAGEIEIKEGVIAAKRHIHTTPEDAAAFGVADKEIVDVVINTELRALVFGDVVVRVSPSFATAMHIDTDEANAAGASGEVYATIVREA
jgi:putative phosphotransacetylase